MDGKSPAVVARLAKQAASMYGELAPLFASPVSAKDEGAAAAHREGAMAAAVAARDEGKEGRAPLFAPPVRGRRRIGRARRERLEGRGWAREAQTLGQDDTFQLTHVITNYPNAAINKPCQSTKPMQKRSSRRTLKSRGSRTRR